MHRIYVFEDNLQFSLGVENLLKEYSEKHSDFIIKELHIVNSNFIASIEAMPKKSSKYNIYLLDINLNDNINGLEVAKRIREFDFDGYIIFFTQHIELAICALRYNIKPLNFIDKGNPNPKELIFTALQQILYELKYTHEIALTNETSNTLIYTYKSFQYRISYSDILFIETHVAKRCLLIHTLSTTYEYPQSLSKLSSLLPKNFYRCHKSYIVNKSKITKLELKHTNYKAFFSDNQFCPISKKHINDFTDIINA
jgi:two-component system response regulator AgrA